MLDRRRQLGAFAVLALVLLRLATGWHFYREGSAKFVVDPRGQRVAVDFSADGFLRQAKGPATDFTRSFLPGEHDWGRLLAVARQTVPPTEAAAQAAAQWQYEYDQRRAQAARANEPVPVEFPPSAPYLRWAERIVADWEETLRKVEAIPGVTDAERAAASAALNNRKQQLADYLAGESEAIAEYQHELWRLENLRNSPAAQGTPFVEEQVAAKTAQAGQTPSAWVARVRGLDEEYYNDLRKILASEEREELSARAAVDEALATTERRNLNIANQVVAILIVSVGICLMIGLLTRLAAVAGALFLLAVMATQPPWVAEATTTYVYYQAVELAGLLVLAGTGAGRWAGLDYFGYAFCRRFCRRGDAEVA
jgi:uncharacterized membrane protein YphA (DoxX/SURF4 family)